jgi:hypothetical protein
MVRCHRESGEWAKEKEKMPKNKESQIKVLRFNAG